MVLLFHIPFSKLLIALFFCLTIINFLKDDAHPSVISHKLLVGHDFKKSIMHAKANVN